MPAAPPAGARDDLPAGEAGNSPAPQLAPPVQQTPATAPPVASTAAAAPGATAPPSTIVGALAPNLTIRYVVTPHPDDEFEAWSMVDESLHYTVFILLTRGENSGFCNGAGISTEVVGDQARLAERIPFPQPFQGPGQVCAQQRIDAWSSFLNEMSSADSAVDLPTYLGEFNTAIDPNRFIPSRLSGGLRVPATNYQLWVGPKTARFVFDLGDGDLSENEVIWAIDRVRELRSKVLPVQAEDSAIAAAYYNDRFSGGVTYVHPDHAAVQDALLDHDFGLPRGQYGRTVPGDPDRTITLSIQPSVYCAAMCVAPGPIDPTTNPNALRSGFLQRNYGWLAPAYWAGAELPSGSIFSRSQDFWRRFGG